jgi:hypothetical protein
MTRMLGLLAALCVPVAAAALPAPPQPPDIAAFCKTVGKAVEKGEWSDADAAAARAVVQGVFDRANAAADRRATLPVNFATLTASPVAKDVDGANPDGNLVVVENVKGTTATGSAIFASGDAHFTSVKNCVIVARNVRFTSAVNCVIVAAEYLRGTGVGSGKQPDESLLVAGKWLRLTGATGTVCHVISPGKEPPPDQKFQRQDETAIRMTGATGVTFLNARTDWGTTHDTDCKTIELKAPIAR